MIVASFPANRWQFERKARECDVVVCIVAHRYGFVPDKGQGSITRREVEAAKAAGRDELF